MTRAGIKVNLGTSSVLDKDLEKAAKARPDLSTTIGRQEMKRCKYELIYVRNSHIK